MEPDFREITLGHLQHIPRVGQEHIAVVAVFGHKLVFALFEVFKSLGIVTFYPASLIEADGFPAALGSILVEKAILYDLELQLPDSAYDFTAIELVDLNLDFHNWTYASLWNLQFGRFSIINNSRDTDYIAAVVSLLLNTPLSSSTASADDEPVLRISADGEYFTGFELDFYKQEQSFYVQFKFNGVINNTILQAFADKMQNKLYQISAEDMEKLINAVNSGTSQ